MSVLQDQRLQPDLSEVHLAHARHLCTAYRDYNRSTVATDDRGLTNSVEAIALGTYMVRRGEWWLKEIGLTES